MATYIKVDYTGQLVAQAKADIEANRWRAYDSQENAQALQQASTIKLEVEKSPDGQRSYWNGSSRRRIIRDEPAATPLIAMLETAPTAIGANGALTGLTFTVKFDMLTRLVKERIRGEDLLPFRDDEIIRDAKTVTSTADVPGLFVLPAQIGIEFVLGGLASGTVLSFFGQSITGSAWLGSVNFGILAVALYEVEDNSAEKLRYVSPVPAVLFNVQTIASWNQVLGPAPTITERQAAFFEQRGTVTQQTATIGRPNSGVAWGQQYISAYQTSGVFPAGQSSGPPPSNIRVVDVSRVRSFWEVFKGLNFTDDSSLTRSASTLAIIKDPRPTPP